MIIPSAIDFSSYNCIVQAKKLIKKLECIYTGSYFDQMYIIKCAMKIEIEILK